VSSRVLELDGRRLLMTNLEAAVWADLAFTKGDLVNYYLDISPFLLPFLVNRPISLMKCPEGENEDCVFQKTAPPGLPAWIPTRRIRSEHAALGYAEYVLGSDRAALAYLVNLGCISQHPWGCTVDAIDRPDQLLFDVDPTEIAFREVRNAALLLRDLLMRYNVRSWVKTSGGRGLHVMVPLVPAHSFDQVRTAAETITRMARTREPSLFTFDMRRARRRGKILIDVHRNHRGATLIGPYAVRHQSALVSTPVEWAELERATYPEDFHLENTRDRLRRVGDPMANFFTSPQSLTPLLETGRSRRARPMA
jgi:bifunctional non-homologous end joining protein LigD